MTTINDNGEGLMNPIMQCGDLLYCQQSDGEYQICERGIGVVQSLGYDDPSDEFEAELKKMGFEEVNPDGNLVY